MTEDKVAALILAAGRSSRMGAFKPLMPLGERTVLETLIFTYRRAGVSDILVVLGHRAAEVQSVLEKHGVAWVKNEHYDEGMFSSIQCGIQKLPPACEVFFLQPADMPRLRSETIRALIAAWRENDLRILHPCHEGRRGHPPLISTALLPAILAFDEPGGMRAFLPRIHDGVQHIECNDPGILADMDTPDDFRKIAGWYPECL